jgi:Cytochrome c
MSRFVPYLALAVLPVLGQSGRIVPIAIYTQFQQRPSEAVSSSIRKEVEEILAPLGLAMEWRSLEGVRGNDVSVDLAVVAFRGSCDTFNLGWWAVDPPGALGITHLVDGEVIPFTDIDCDRIRIFLAKHLVTVLPKNRNAIYGRAVGRVLAHELFHIFARTKHHGPGGVAEPFFSQSDLMADQFQFDSSDLRLLRASLKQARRQNNRVRSVASALSGSYIFREDGCSSCHGLSGGGTGSAPALRVSGKPLDPKMIGAKLVKGVSAMYSHSRNRHLKLPALDEDEIADLVSFLNGSN